MGFNGYRYYHGYGYRYRLVAGICIRIPVFSKYPWDLFQQIQAL